MRFTNQLGKGRPVVLSALGDSLTYGYLVRRGYVDMVESELRTTYLNGRLSVLNHGVCGDTVFDGLDRADEAFYGPQPDLGFIEFGLNDCFQGITPQRFAAGLEQLLDECGRRAPSMEILLLPPIPVEPPSFQRAAEPYRAAYRNLAAEFKLPIVDFATPWRAASSLPLWQGDGVHPTEAGYHVMANAVLAALGVKS